MPSTDKAKSQPSPNHHAGQSPFNGLSGTLVGLSMIIGRGKDARLACNLAAVTSSDRVVDIGCGPGVAARAAARIGAHVTGIDPAAPMIRLARLLGSSSVDYLRGSAEAVPLPDNSQTVAWSLATAHHWTNVETGVSEMRRILQAGGRFLVIERRSFAGATGLRSHGWTPEQAEAFAAVCAAQGFTQVSVQACQGRRDSLALIAVAP